MSRIWKDAATVILAARCAKKSVDKIPAGVSHEFSAYVDSITPTDTATATGTGPMPMATSSSTERDKQDPLDQESDYPPASRGVPEFDYKILMLGRSKKSSFMPSAYVFPGGQIGTHDFSDKWCDLFKTVFDFKDLKEYSLSRLGISQPPPGISEGISESSDSDGGKIKKSPRLPMFEAHDGRGRDVSSEIAFRISAIRETFEESGILLCTNTNKMDLNIDPEIQEVRLDRSLLMDSCLKPGVDFDEGLIAKWRTDVINDNDRFVDMCIEMNVVPNVWILNDWSCWLTPAHMPKMHNKRRYDTVFYLACIPEIQVPLHDDQEITSAEWANPLDLLCRYYSEELWLAPPQVYELCRMCSKPALDDLHQFAVQREQHGWQHWLPVRITCEDGTIAVLPGDEIYPKEPDFVGAGRPLIVSQSVSELRTNTMTHHRFEFLGMHNTAVLCTQAQTNRHLSPNYGSKLWEGVRDRYTLSAKSG